MFLGGAARSHIVVVLLALRSDVRDDLLAPLKQGVHLVEQRGQGILHQYVPGRVGLAGDASGGRGGHRSAAAAAAYDVDRTRGLRRRRRMPPPGGAAYDVAAGVVDILQQCPGAPALLVVPCLVDGRAEPAETRQRARLLLLLLLLIHGFCF